MMELDLRRVLPDFGCRVQAAAVRDQLHLRGNLPDELLRESPECPGGCPVLRHRVMEPAVRAARGQPGQAEPHVGPAHDRRPAPPSQVRPGMPWESRPNSSAQTIVAPNF